jgi:hypothetical protein
MAYNPMGWHDFYIMSGGAAAALVGLLFVGMTTRADDIKRNWFWSSRAIGTLMLLTAQLLISAAVLIPEQPLTLLGLEIEVAALLFVFLTVRAWVINIRGGRLPKMSWKRRGAEIVGQLLWNGFFVGSGLSLYEMHGGGFYWLAFVMVGAFAWNVYVLWGLIVELQRAGEGP